MTFQPILSKDSEKLLLTDYADGWTVHELTIIYKISTRTVYRILSKHRVKRQKPKNKSYRRKQKRAKIIFGRQLQPCGTNAAYQRHRKHGEYPCTPCLAAHSLNVKEAKEKR